MMPQPNPWESMLDEIAERVAERVAQRLKEKEGPRLLTPAEAARYLGRSARWLREASARGVIKPVEIEGARPRYDRKALDQWIDERS